MALPLERSLTTATGSRNTLSKGYETYAGDETDRMWDRKKRERGELGLWFARLQRF